MVYLYHKDNLFIKKVTKGDISMGKVFKKVLSVFLVVLMLLTSAQLQGFVGLEPPNIFNLSSFAAEYTSVDEFTFTVLNGTYCSITGYKGTATEGSQGLFLLYFSC